MFPPEIQIHQRIYIYITYTPLIMKCFSEHLEDGPFSSCERRERSRKRSTERSLHSPFKGTVMQIEKALINFVLQKYPENFEFQLFTFLH